MPDFLPTDCEPIWAALLTQLQTRMTPDGYKTMSRHHVQPPKLSPEQQPALFCVQARETYAQRPVIGAGGKTTLSGFLVIYFRVPPPSLQATGTETVLGATLLNALLLGVKTALLPDNPVTGKLTLGGLCQHCWLEGDADMDDGIVSQQGAAILPIRILVP